MSIDQRITRCQHIKVDGVQCGSPALRGKPRCYFHQNMRRQLARKNSNRLAFPLLEDANSVQCALMQVLRAIASDQLDARKATLMLYGLQTASINLKHVQFEHGPAELVVDRAAKILAPADPANLYDRLAARLSPSVAHDRGAAEATARPTASVAITQSPGFAITK